MSLLEVDGLVKSYPLKRNVLGRATDHFLAVDDVSFTLEQGETLALVGESGAGKSTLGRLVLRLIDADRGTITFEGRDVRALDAGQLRAMRRHAQMIFQDPFSSLGPHLPVGESLTEPFAIHFGTGRAERHARALELIERVGLQRNILNRYPAELSGGQLQRIAIARALTLEPHMIVCDEPVAALDVSVRAQVLNLMQDLQEQLGLAYLFVSHDLALVEVIADRVAVMRQGKIVEMGATGQIFSSPQHPYTRELLDAIPVAIPRSLRA